MAAEDVINTAYLSTLGRPADPEGLAFYSAQLEAGRPVGEILADLNFAVESGTENVLMNKLAQPLDRSQLRLLLLLPQQIDPNLLPQT
jgi:hypothetical protein